MSRAELVDTLRTVEAQPAAQATVIYQALTQTAKALLELCASNADTTRPAGRKFLKSRTHDRP